MNDAAYVVIIAVGLGLLTLAARASFFMIPSRYQLPPRLERALRYAPACALAAIVAPSVFNEPGGAINFDLSNPRLWAVVAASLAFVRTRNMMTMMGIGMAVFTVIRLFG